MNTLKHSRSMPLQAPRSAHARNSNAWNHSSLARSRSLVVAKRRRERVLAFLALVMLIIAWDATLRLDERVSPPRMRMAHAVEVEGENQTWTSVE